MEYEWENDRRSFPRVPAQGQIVCMLNRTSAPVDLQGRVLNISRTGAQLALPSEVAPGDPIRLHLVQSGWRIPATVQWAFRSNDQQNWLAGCQFHDPFEFVHLVE